MIPAIPGIVRVKLGMFPKKPVMQAMADELGVSFTAMLIQLRKYGLLEERDMAEYFERTKDSDKNE